MGVPVPPPWMILSFLLTFTGHLQDIKEIFGLGLSLATGKGEDAGCKICDKLVGMILKQVELSDIGEGGGVDCKGLCFNVGKCVHECDKIVGAMANSTGFPCIAAGLCPDLDEFGEVSCKFSYKSMGCEPSNACETKFPARCSMRSGFKKWKKVGRMFSDELGALGDGFRARKSCSEPGAGPYCIRDAQGLGRLAELGGLFMTIVGGAAFSIRAIESPGGDDDRQWLTFWMIFFVVMMFERYVAVLLSRASYYYECKFVVFLWLMFMEGADKIYRSVRFLLKRVNHLLPFLGLKWKEPTEEEYIRKLPKRLWERVRADGVEKLFSGFRCDKDVADQFGEMALYQLWLLWNKVDPRYLSLNILSASDLPPMDSNGTTDAYVIAYLDPPDRRLPPSPLSSEGLSVEPSEEPLTPSLDKDHLPDPTGLPGALSKLTRAGTQPLLSADRDRSAAWGKIRQGRRSKAMASESVELMNQQANGWNKILRAFFKFQLIKGIKSILRSLKYKVNQRWRRSFHRVSSIGLFPDGPLGPPGLYSKVRSSVAKRSLNPTWRNEHLELRLEGGRLNGDGEYDNPDAPYTKLRLEIWDRDLLSTHDFIGEATLPLCPLMDSRTHRYTLSLTDPEGKSKAPGGVQGTISIEVRYES